MHYSQVASGSLLYLLGYPFQVAHQGLASVGLDVHPRAVHP